VAHAAENMLDKLRSNEMELSDRLIDLLCQSCDFSRNALDQVASEYNDEAMAESAKILTASFRELLETPASEPPPQEPAHTEEESLSIPDLELTITPEMLERFIQESDELLQLIEQAILTWSENPRQSKEQLQEAFRAMHSFKGNCGFFGYEHLERLSHQTENVFEFLCDNPKPVQRDTDRTLLQVVDKLREAIAGLGEDGNGEIPDLEQHIRELEHILSPEEDGDMALLGQILVEDGVVSPDVVAQAVAQQQKPLGELLVDMGVTDPAIIEKALSKQKKRAAAQPARKERETKSVTVQRQDIRVDLKKLDQLVDLIGELVIAENMLVHNPDLNGLELENFTKSAQQMGKIIRELQEVAMYIRMVPVAGLFRRMFRLVHDLSGKSGKKVHLQISGEDTELDKTVIETITDPLVHILRNSVDHGIEPPEERIEAGKAEQGTVWLSARHEEGEVWITIQDDGRGLNREKILAKARSNGLVEGDGSDLSDKAVFGLIFQPGFSTAEKITDISGRGVGMDVVKQNLSKIKGKIDVESVEGEGTTLTLRIPLTLGIIEGMMVRVGRAKCIIPLLAIREIFRPEPDKITRTPDGLELVKVRDDLLPVRRLHTILNLTSDSTELSEGILVVLEYQETLLCLLVDEILGQQQTVIKGLSDYIGSVKAISGCTILGNGEVCLILDIRHIVEEE
jgi:two-component system chemotaxis sensor kinase CheA